MQTWIVFGRCFQDGQADEVIVRARAYGLFDVWKASVEAFCECLPCTCPEELMKACNQLMLSCLQPLLRQKEDNPAFLTPESDCSILVNAAFRLLHYSHKKANIAPEVFAALFLKTIQHCCHQPTDYLMLGAMMKELIVRNILTVPLIPLLPQSRAIIKKTVRLMWNPYADDKCSQQPLFAYDFCKTFPGVRNPEIITALMKDGDDNLKIIVPNRHLPAVLVLCDLMVKAGRLSCKGSRGYMQFLGNHIVAPEGEDKYNPNTFRLIKCRALDSEGEKITIKNQIKDLFFKYCTGEEAKKIFKNYFS